jgi:ribose transport system substrate-binding protein
MIAGLVSEDPFRVGYDGVKTALAASKGEQVLANYRYQGQPLSPRPT